MPRKRGKRKSTVVKPVEEKESYRKTFEKTFKKKRNYFIPVVLIGIFFLVLFMNSYFNYTSGIAYNPSGETLGTKYYLSGPDPYYNMRLCEQTLETGHYPFVELSDGDPLLNYPVGVYAGARPPLFNMIAVGSTQLLQGLTGMPQMDALGWCMLFLPAIYGALVVFPIYGIGKELFNKKVGLLSALLVPLIPIHLGSGHGSAFSLFDHDSFLFLLFAITFFFVIKMLKEQEKTKVVLYSFLTGVSLACIEMTWAASQTIFLMLIIYLVVQLFFDIFKKEITKKEMKTPAFIAFALIVAYLISMPYTLAVSKLFTYLFISANLAIAIFVIYLILQKLKTPWIISLPGFCVLGGIGYGFLWMVNKGILTISGPLKDISDVIFGSGIYGTQVALTIGEAHTFGISQTVMSFGPFLYWFGLCGFILFLYKTFKEKFKPYHMFFIVIFVIQFWMTTAAGRFLNDMIIGICVFSAFVIWIVIDKVDYKSMMRNIGNLRGIHKFKGAKPIHYFGVLFVVGLVFLPNAYISLDAAVPGSLKEEVFGEGHSGAFGLGLGQQYYWADACYWLSQQDTEYNTDAERPGVLTWWDYGFYLASMSKHPTVADNYQEGLRCAGNFHTSQTEEEATCVLIIRLVEGVKEPIRQPVGTIPQDVKDLFYEYLEDDCYDLINIIENPIEYAPSYDTLISPEYDNTFLRVDEINAMYHDATDILLMFLSDYELTSLYHDMMEITDSAIRYYGIEYRDMYEIFGVFPFLSDKGTHSYATLEDDWYKTGWIDSKTGRYYTLEEINNLTQTEIQDMDLSQTTQRKDTYFNSIAYKTYFGAREGTGDTLPDNRIPCYFLSHWKPEYVSPYMTIASYYEGANITGTVKVGPYGYDGTAVIVMDEYGVPHDICQVENGAFNVIGLSGNTTLQLYIENNLLDKINIGEITEEEATWEVESNYTAEFNINLSSVDVNMENITEGLFLNLTGINYPSFVFYEDAFNGTVSFPDLIPGRYNIAITNETGYSLYSKDVYLKPDDNQYDVILGGEQ